MKTRITMILLAFSAVLLAHAVVLSHPATAQTYGESVYGSGVYEDPRTAPETDRGLTSSGESAPIPGSDATNGSEERDASEEQESPDEDHKPHDSGDTRNSGDTTAELDTDESKESDSSSPTHLLWLSLGALLPALLLILFAVLRRRRTQD